MHAVRTLAAVPYHDQSRLSFLQYARQNLNTINWSLDRTKVRNVDHHRRAVRRKGLAQFAINLWFVLVRTNEVWNDFDAVESKMFDCGLLQIIRDRRHSI